MRFLTPIASNNIPADYPPPSSLTHALRPHRIERSVPDDLPEHPELESLVLSHTRASERFLRLQRSGNRISIPANRGSTHLRRQRTIRIQRKRDPGPNLGETSVIKTRIVECDGGCYDSASFPVQNVIEDTSDVYCTANFANVNLSIAQRNFMPFNLAQVIIRAPAHGFTSPVRDGLLFVSMNEIKIDETRLYDRQEPDNSCTDDEGAIEDSDDEGFRSGCSTPPSLPVLSQTRSGTLAPVASFMVDQDAHEAKITFSVPLWGLRDTSCSNFSGQKGARSGHRPPEILTYSLLYVHQSTPRYDG
ncbi:hypothetical protein NEOLI_003433 [Neolecta irregularis DAH-3]|uniref:Uncharacterized protein n=1 Tax=Neolecta irregularis (strain DAH-3) TaxID=1198029 RepID=A0A1U7LRP6_NEOID|nr:hypothetical protein NEOLI_003433 [Neolecta irregularis DAH-3]|eukprot:OLL25299.1 hypothetical protein NEOLI_003433 [Neolecta irregularis DAH-3]